MNNTEKLHEQPPGDATPETPSKDATGKKRNRKIVAASVAAFLALAMTGAAIAVPAFQKATLNKEYDAVISEIQAVNEEIANELTAADQLTIENGVYAANLEALENIREVIKRAESSKAKPFTTPQLEALDALKGVLVDAPTFTFHQKNLIKEATSGSDVITPASLTEGQVKAKPHVPEQVSIDTVISTENLENKRQELKRKSSTLNNVLVLVESRQADREILQDTIAQAPALLGEAITGLSEHSETVLKDFAKAEKKLLTKLTELVNRITATPSTDITSLPETVDNLLEYVETLDALKISHDKKVKEEKEKKAKEDAKKAAEKAAASGATEFKDPTTGAWVLVTEYYEETWNGGGSTSSGNNGGGWNPPPATGGGSGGGGGYVPPANNGGGGTTAPQPVACAEQPAGTVWGGLGSDGCPIWAAPEPYICPPQPPGYYPSGSTHTIRGVTCPNYVPAGSGGADDW